MVPNVYSYHDYRAYLIDALAYLKRHKGMSQRKVSKAMGISPSYLNMIVKGERKFKDQALFEFSKQINLNIKEIGYLELLVQMAEGDDLGEKNKALNEAVNSETFIENNPNDYEAYKYLSHWQNVAIREMVNLKDFKLDATWIREKLLNKLSLKEIRESLSFLIKNKFLNVTANRQSINTKKALNCMDGVYKISLGQFHSQMLKLADESIGNTPTPERLILGHTQAISEENFQEANQILLEALEKIKKLKKAKYKNTRVYHLEMALFPLTKGKK